MKFQELINRTIVSIAISTCFVTIGCDKQEDKVPVINNTIAGLILKGADFNLLEALLAKANLAITLDGPGPFTIFAPDDSAFTSSGITLSFINSLRQQQAQSILLYHMFNSKVLVAGLPSGPNAKMTTFNGDSVFITKSNNDIYVNGAKVSQNDIIADNGIIHKIENVLNPPVGNIVQTVTAYGLDSLAKAISRATNDSTGNPGLTTGLNTATLTMFAPTDSAFVKLLSAITVSDINDIPVDALVDILNYHITAGLVFSSDLVEGSLIMLAGGNTTVNLANGVDGGPTITGMNNGGNTSNITTLNIASHNAVIHLIDRVLIP